MDLRIRRERCPWNTHPCTSAGRSKSHLVLHNIVEDSQCLTGNVQLLTRLGCIIVFPPKNHIKVSLTQQKLIIRSTGHLCFLAGPTQAQQWLRRWPVSLKTQVCCFILLLRKIKYKTSPLCLVQMCSSGPYRQPGQGAGSLCWLVWGPSGSQLLAAQLLCQTQKLNGGCTGVTGISGKESSQRFLWTPKKERTGIPFNCNDKYKRTWVWKNPLLITRGHLNEDSSEHLGKCTSM